MANSSGVIREQLSSLRSVYSGGAPIPSAAVRVFQDKFGHYIHNGYGLTDEHPAVVGVPDTHRGESVKALVSFKPDNTATDEDLIEFCKQRLARKVSYATGKFVCWRFG